MSTAHEEREYIRKKKLPVMGAFFSEGLKVKREELWWKSASVDALFFLI